MKTYKDIEITEKELVSITCDRCKRVDDDIMEIQEYLHYVNDAGYGSVMGDGNMLRLDLCQRCTKELLGTSIRVVGNYIWAQEYNPPVTLIEVQKKIDEAIISYKNVSDTMLDHESPDSYME